MRRPCDLPWWLLGPTWVVFTLACLAGMLAVLPALAMGGALLAVGLPISLAVRAWRWWRGTA